MNKTTFLKEFRAILPDTLSDTSIDLDNIEMTTLLFIGETISRMSREADNWYCTTDTEMNETLVDIVARKYNIEW